MKREYLLSLKKFSRDCLQNFIKEANEEKINEIYENEKWTEHIHCNGVNLYRVNYLDKETEKEIKEFAEKNNLKEYRHNFISNAGYRGNFCYPYVLEEHALKIKEKFGDKIKLDLKRHILGYTDIKDLKEGDKVVLNKTSDFGINSDNKGKVYNIDKEKGEITIIKYRSRNKGWKIRLGEEAIIKKGWTK